MNRQQGIDWFLLGSVVALLFLGIVLVYSSSSHQAMVQDRSTFFFLAQHLKKLVVGFVVMGIGLLLSPKVWKSLARPLFVISILFLLLLLFSPLGISINGARRWLDLGVRFQPAELAKIAFVFFLALKLAENQEKIREFKEGIVPAVVITSILFVLLISQPNFSMAIAICAIAASMLYIAGCRKSHFALLGVIAIPVIGLIGTLKPYRMKRILSFLNPGESSAADYQQAQALLSLGNGGLFGTGLGSGTQKLGYLPMASTDTIFAILGEELGFIGSFVLLALFAVLIWRGFAIARRQEDLFFTLVAVGLVVSIAINVFVHVGVCTRLGPPTGQPLPLVSYGGTNLFATMFSCGILLKMSRPPSSRGGVL